MKTTNQHARRAYTYRRIGVGLIAFAPVWLAYIYVGTQSILASALAVVVIAIPTLALSSALFTVADSELAAARFTTYDPKKVK